MSPWQENIVILLNEQLENISLLFTMLYQTYNWLCKLQHLSALLPEYMCIFGGFLDK